MQNITTLNYFIPYASDIQKFRTPPTSSAGEAERRQQLMHSWWQNSTNPLEGIWQSTERLSMQSHVL